MVRVVSLEFLNAESPIDFTVAFTSKEEIAVFSNALSPIVSRTELLE